jgi:nucleolar MIF4G domain-containing protein 1
LKRDRDEDDSDDDDDDLDLDLDMSEEGTDDDEDDEDADSTVNDLDPDDLLDDEPSDLDEADNESEGEIDLSGGEATSVKDDEEEATAAPTKYVPPHMRAAQLAEKAQGSKEKALSKQKLERKLQGLLNK